MENPLLFAYPNPLLFAYPNSLLPYFLDIFIEGNVFPCKWMHGSAHIIQTIEVGLSHQRQLYVVGHIVGIFPH